MTESSERIVYLNNSATSYPKPSEVCQAVYEAMVGLPQMSGRGEAAGAIDRISEARVKMARFFGCPNPERLIFTDNSTDALNLAIHGFIEALPQSRELPHVISTTNDHNSILRPLRTLETERRIILTLVPSDPEGRFDVDRMREAITKETRMMAVNHLSNVVGTIAPLEILGAICRDKGITFLVDASQSAGLLPIDVTGMNIDLLATTGHKFMLGPTGIGTLYIGEGITLAPRKQGGTGVKSAYPLQPEELPIRFEAGTANYIGIVGLDAARSFIERHGQESMLDRVVEQRGNCEDQLFDIDGVKIYGPGMVEDKGAVISFRIEGFGVAEVDTILRTRYGIITRSGLHCAPLCHERLGTAPEGTVRASFSYLTDSEAASLLVEAVREIAATRTS
jgi:cysteine desulfurase family protein